MKILHTDFSLSESRKSLNQFFFNLRTYFSALTPFFFLAYKMLAKFLKSCPNRDFLGWDPVARFQTSLGFADAIRNFQIHNLLIGFLDSPTWPSLKSLFESFFILVFGPYPLISIILTFCTMLLLGIASTHVLFKELGKDYKNFPLIAFSTVWICLATPYQLYAFSGMLEIQGAFLLLLSVYFLKRIQSKPYLFLLSFACLLQTKYPYAILFCIALFVYIPFLLPARKYIAYLFRHYREYSHRNPILLFLPVPAGTVTLVKLGLLTLPGKLYGYMVYLTVLLLLIHYTHFLLLHRHYTQKHYPTLYILIYWCMLGTAWYLTIHPDRFFSTFSTIRHEQREGETFFYFSQILEDIPYYGLFVIIFLLLKFVSMLLLYKASGKKLKIFVWKEFSKFRKTNPYFFIGILTIIFQSILTPNQQSRHIYHAYPLLQIGILIEIFRLYRLTGKSYSYSKIIHKTIPWILPIFFTSFLVILIWNLDLNVCYAGHNQDVREVPLFIRSATEKYLDNNTILLNDIDKNHINKPDSELEISIFAYKQKLRLLINPKTIEDSTAKYDLVRISFECDEKKLESYIQKYYTDSAERKYKVIKASNPSGKGCWEQVKFTH